MRERTNLLRTASASLLLALVTAAPIVIILIAAAAAAAAVAVIVTVPIAVAAAASLITAPPSPPTATARVSFGSTARMTAGPIAAPAATEKNHTHTTKGTRLLRENDAIYPKRKNTKQTGGVEPPYELRNASMFIYIDVLFIAIPVAILTTDPSSSPTATAHVSFGSAALAATGEKKTQR